MKQLEPFRKKIDELDLQIIELLGQRFNICREVACLKKAENIPMMQAERIVQQKKKCRELAVQNSIDPDFLVELYTLIIDKSCQTEEEIIESK